MVDTESNQTILQLEAMMVDTSYIKTNNFGGNTLFPQ